MIHVCYAISDQDGHYSKFTGASIASIFDNTKSSVTIHLLHDDTLTPDNRRKFTVLADQYSQKIVFYNVGTISKNLWDSMQDTFLNLNHITHLNIASMYRLLAADILPASIERLIYFDSDIIVNLDIKEFYEEPIDANGAGNGLAAVIDELVHTMPELSRLCQTGFFSRKDYFNSGVLLMDMTKLRQNYPDFLIVKKGLAFCDHNPIDYADQDILNFFFQDGYRKLPIKYNIRVDMERMRGNNRLEAGVYHYAGGGFHLRTDDCYSKLFLHYLIITPWFDANLLGRLVSLSKQRYMQKYSLFILNAIPVFLKRKRVFVSFAATEPIIRERFAVQPDEEYIICDSGNNSIPIDPVQKDKVFIFFISNYEGLKNSLLQHNLVEWVDFMNGTLFLQPDQVLAQWAETGKLQDSDDYYIIRDA